MDTVSHETTSKAFFDELSMFFVFSDQQYLFYGGARSLSYKDLSPYAYPVLIGSTLSSVLQSEI